VIDRSATCV